MNRVDLSLVKKDLYKLPSFIIAKLYRWVEGVENDGLEEVRKIPGFHDEPLKGNLSGYRSIRLNRSYRAIYSEHVSNRSISMNTNNKMHGLSQLERDFGPFTFGKMLEAYRLAGEYSQKEFAKMLGISAASLCDLEKGRRVPTPERAVKIAKKLKEPPSFWVRRALQDQLDNAGIKLKVSVA